MATCPECEFDEVDTADLEEGDSVSCPECGNRLILTANGELEFEDEDDLDDDDDIDDDVDDVDDEDDLDDDEDE